MKHFPKGRILASDVSLNIRQMIILLRATGYGALVGLGLGVVIGLAGYLKYDRHGLATIAHLLVFAVLGAMFGLAAGLGACVKQKFEGRSDD